RGIVPLSNRGKSSGSRFSTSILFVDCPRRRVRRGDQYARRTAAFSRRLRIPSRLLPTAFLLRGRKTGDELAFLAGALASPALERRHRRHRDENEHLEQPIRHHRGRLTRRTCHLRASRVVRQYAALRHARPHDRRWRYFERAPGSSGATTTIVRQKEFL